MSPLPNRDEEASWAGVGLTFATVTSSLPSDADASRAAYTNLAPLPVMSPLPGLGEEASWAGADLVFNTVTPNLWAAS